MSNNKTMIRITTDGTVTEIPNTGYESIREAIGGGYLEIVPMGAAHGAYIDEEGKLKSLPVNRIATLLWYKRFGYRDDMLCGDCVIVRTVNENGEHDGEDHSPIPEILAQAQDLNLLHFKIF